MTLVQTPRLVDGQPFAIHCLKNVVQRVDSALEVRGVAHIEVKASFSKGAAAIGCFFAARIGKVDVHPAGEKVQLVPFAFAVADQDELHGRISHDSFSFS